MPLNVDTRPRLKPLTHVFRRADDFLVCDWSRQVTWTIRLSESAVKLLKLADGSRTVSELAASCDVSTAAAIGFLSRVDDLDLLTVVTAGPDDPRSGVVEAFEPLASRTLTSTDMVSSLARASVAVVGVGGVGTWVCQHLAMHGVGHLLLVDPDAVAAENLHRQTLFRIEDVGVPKVEAAARAVHSISPSTRTTMRRVHVTHKSDRGLLEGVDLAIAAADQPSTSEASALVSALCFRSGIPHIAGFGYTSITGALPQTVIPADPHCACLFCEKPQLPPHIGTFEFVAPGGRPLGPVAAALGSLVSLEAIRLLTRYEEPSFKNVRGDFDFRSLRSWRVSIHKDPHCWFCSTAGEAFGPGSIAAYAPESAQNER